MLAEISREPDDFHPVVLLTKRLHDFPARVPASILDEDQLEIASNAFQGLFGALIEFRQRPRALVNRDND